MNILLVDMEGLESLLDRFSGLIVAQRLSDKSGYYHSEMEDAYIGSHELLYKVSTSLNDSFNDMTILNVMEPDSRCEYDRLIKVIAEHIRQSVPLSFVESVQFLQLESTPHTSEFDDRIVITMRL